MKKAVLLIKKTNTNNFSKKELDQYDLHFSENVWIAAFLKPLYFIFWIIVLLFVCLNTGISKFPAPTPSSLGPIPFYKE